MLSMHIFDCYRFFMLANSVACAYLFISLPLSIFQMVKVASVTPRLTLLIFDTVCFVCVVFCHPFLLICCAFGGCL